MGILGYIAALIIMAFDNTSGLNFMQGVDKFLVVATDTSQVMFWIVLCLWLVSVVLLFILGKIGPELRDLAFGCGCFQIFLVILPVLQLIVWQATAKMSVILTPEGPSDPTKFLILAIVTLLCSAG